MSELHEPLNVMGMPMVYTCRGCGAVVHDMSRHDEWHQSINNHSHEYRTRTALGGSVRTSTAAPRCGDLGEAKP